MKGIPKLSGVWLLLVMASGLTPLPTDTKGNSSVNHRYSLRIIPVASNSMLQRSAYRSWRRTKGLVPKYKTGHSYMHGMERKRHKRSFLKRSAIVQATFLGQNLTVLPDMSCTASPPTARGCQCDTACVLFGDCCFDAFVKFGLNSSSSVRKVMRKPLPWFMDHNIFSVSSRYFQLLYEYGTCVAMSQNHSTVRMHMVSKYPVDKGLNSVKANCERRRDTAWMNVPVSFRFARPYHTAFVNPFCALYHGVLVDDILPWRIEARCPNSTDFDQPLSSVLNTLERKCHKMIFPPPSLTNPRTCIPAKYKDDRCSGTLPTLTCDHIACRSYLAPFSKGIHVFKNIHCAQCCRDRQQTIPPSTPAQTTLPNTFPGQSSTAQPGRVSGQSPTAQPGGVSGQTPTAQPGLLPGQSPTAHPGRVSGQTPTAQPGRVSGQTPTAQPGLLPGQTPTAKPGLLPGQSPTAHPGGVSGQTPTAQPGLLPGQTPTAKPGLLPGQSPTAQPGGVSGQTPTAQPGLLPGQSPTAHPGRVSGQSPTAQTGLLPGQTPTAQTALPPGWSPTTQAGFFPSPPPSPLPTIAGGNVYMTVLFDFSFLTGYSIRAGNKDLHKVNNCVQNFTYDYIHAMCKPIICSPGLVLQNGNCVQDRSISVINDPLIFPFVSSSSQHEHFARVEVTGMKMTKEVIRLTLAKMFNEQLADNEDGEMNVGFETIDSTKQLSTNITRYAVAFAIKTNQSVTKLLQKLHHVSRYLPTSVSNILISNVFDMTTVNCRNGQTLIQYARCPVGTDNKTAYVIDHQTGLVRKFDMEVLRFSVSVDEGSGDLVTDWFMFCSHLSCPMIELNTSEYFLANDTLHINHTDEAFYPGGYELSNSSAFVCASGRAPDTWIVWHVRELQIVSYVVLSLSVLGLLLTIFAYARTNLLQSLHGKTMVSMSVTLAIAQLAMLALVKAELHDILCKIAAIVLHVSWLSVFAWLSILSYDMLRTFVIKPMRVRSLSPETRRYKIYCALGWGAPLLFVSCCVGLDIGAPSLHIGYGENGYCFISNSLGTLLLFSTPLTLSLFFNIVCFALIVYFINSRRSGTPMTQKEDRGFSVIVLKLSMLTGVAWLFAFAASLTDNVVLWFIHMSLNGLNGVFVFFAFGLRKMVSKVSREQISALNLSSFGDAHSSVS